MQIRQLAERLTMTLESITDAFFTLDREWRFTFLNDEAERLLGRNREELNGKIVWNEFPDAVGSTFEHEYLRAMTDKTAVEFEEFYPPLDTWFSVHAYPSDQGLAVFFRDISESKRIAEEIKLTNTILQTQQEISPDAILVIDENRRVLSYNQQFIELWRLPLDFVDQEWLRLCSRSCLNKSRIKKYLPPASQQLYEHQNDKS